MILRSRGTADFWALYRALPAATKSLARKNYLLWSRNAFHPSLHFKPMSKPNWSVRIGDHYRAVGVFSSGEVIWEWIGSHEEYNKRF